MDEAKVGLSAERVAELRRWAERMGHVPSLELLTEIDRLRAEQPATQAPVPELLQGVLSGTRDGLTVEDYARMAQASAEQWEESLIDNVVELSPDQFCALFDLARAGLTKHARVAPVQAVVPFEVTDELVRLLLDRICYDDGQVRGAKQVADGLRVVFGEALSSAANGIGAGNWHARAVRAERELAKRSPEPAQAVVWGEELAKQLYRAFVNVTAVTHEFALYKAGLKVFGSGALQVPNDVDRLMMGVDAVKEQAQRAEDASQLAGQYFEEARQLRAQLEAIPQMAEQSTVEDDVYAKLGQDAFPTARQVASFALDFAKPHARAASYWMGEAKRFHGQLEAANKLVEEQRASHHEEAERLLAALEAANKRVEELEAEQSRLARQSADNRARAERAERAEAQLASLREACAWRGGLDAVVADLRSDKPYPHPQVAVYMARIHAALNAPPQQPAEVAKRSAADALRAAWGSDPGARDPFAAEPTEPPNALGEALDKAHVAFADEPEWSEVAKPEAHVPASRVESSARIDRLVAAERVYREFLVQLHNNDAPQNAATSALDELDKIARGVL